MRKVVVLAVVGIALVVALAFHGTSVLPRLSTDDAATPSVGVTPTGTPRSTPTPRATRSPATTPTAEEQADPDAPVPGTVLTARPAPRRCPSPPCVP